MSAAATPKSAETVTLSHGVPIPTLGLGVFRTGAGAGTRDAVRYALEVGYRHIDTAAIYRNEVEVGEAIRSFCAESGVPREAVFVTTKLWNDDHGYDAALRAFDRSRERLGLAVIDLYLIHWPVPEGRLASWRALETLLDDPVVLGVAGELERSPAQVLIRWSIEQGHVVLPKSSNPGRITENAQVFDFALGTDALARLETLAERSERTAWDPTRVD